MTRLLDFYRGDGTDSEGRHLAAILAWDDDALEEVHDYIQWLFPLPEASNYNSDAPVLTAGDVAAFQAEPGLRARLRQAFERFLSFAGLRLEAGRVVDGPNLAERFPEVWAHFNHNWLRVTRVLRSLHLLGLGDESRAFLAWLREGRDSGRLTVPADTWRYWEAAAGG